MTNTKQKTPSPGAFKRLFQYITIKKQRLPFLFVCILILVSSLSTIAISLSLKIVVDDFILPLSQEVTPNFDQFYLALFLLGGIFLMGVLASFLYNMMIIKIGQNVMKSLRDELFTHMQRLPISFFDQNADGSIMSVYTNDIDTIRQMINESLPQLIQALFMVVLSLAFMLILSPYLASLAFLMLFLMFFVTKKMASKSGKLFASRQKNIASLTAYVEEMVTGQRVIKVFHREEEVKKNFDALNEDVFNSTKDASIGMSKIPPVITYMGNSLFVITAILGGFLFIHNIGGITIGLLASYLQFTKSFTQPFMQISQQLNSVVMALAGSKRIFALLDEPLPVDQGNITLLQLEKEAYPPTLKNSSDFQGKKWIWADEKNTSYTILKGEVKIENLTFGYVEGEPVLNNISFYAKAGQKIALVGSTGAGKTTITNLINRFYEIDSGKITYDGINIQDIEKNSLRRSLGIVLQDIQLFTGSIMENIRYGRLDASDEEVIAAAKLAYADSFIHMLPQGYDTIFQPSGDELSQGQKQLICIARAALSNPPVLILDEATSSIDTRTETLVQKGMDNLMKGRTVFVIAHRLSTIQNSDCIMVLEHGEIIERGSHEELMEKKGMYYELYTGSNSLPSIN